MTEVVQVSLGQTQSILALKEDYYVDFKAKEVLPGKLTRWVSAFGNSSGGEIYVGISEHDGSFAWKGFKDPEDANDHTRTLQEHFPPSDSVTYSLLLCEERDGYVLRVEVSRHRGILTASDGKVYRRVSGGISPIEDDEGLRILRLQKGITSQESETLAAEIELIADSYQVTEFVSEVVPTTEPIPWLRKQLLIREDRPTVAGVILFADEPQVLLPKASVIVYRYSTEESIGSRSQLVDEKTHLVEGSAYRQIKDSVALTVRLIEDVRDRELNEVSYPPETLHEIITNAIIHRDYSIKDNVHVRIFDDRVEVESPGRLPGHVTPKNILATRFSRNESIERLLHKFPDPPNKNVGEGLNTAFQAMNRMRLADPEVMETEQTVLIIIRHQPLDSPATMILNYLEEHGTISNGEARRLTGISRDNEVLRLFRSLEAKGAIERVPGTIKGGSRYRKAGTSHT